MLEIGLNYGRSHLLGDADKLIHSGIRHPYIVHFTRNQPVDQSVEKLIIELPMMHSRIKLAYASVRDDRVRVKRISGNQIRAKS